MPTEHTRHDTDAVAPHTVRDLKRAHGLTEVWTYDLRGASPALAVRTLVGSEYPTRMAVGGDAWAPAEIDEKAKHVTYRPEQ